MRYFSDVLLRPDAETALFIGSVSLLAMIVTMGLDPPKTAAGDTDIYREPIAKTAPALKNTPLLLREGKSHDPQFERFAHCE